MNIQLSAILALGGTVAALAVALFIYDARLDAVSEERDALLLEARIYKQKIETDAELLRLANASIEELSRSRAPIAAARDQALRASQRKDGEIAPVLREAIDALGALPPAGGLRD